MQGSGVYIRVIVRGTFTLDDGGKYVPGIGGYAALVRTRPSRNGGVRLFLVNSDRIITGYGSTDNTGPIRIKRPFNDELVGSLVEAFGNV